MKTPVLSDEELNILLTQLDGWELRNKALEKSFTFKNFSEAFAFMCRVALEAEKMNHHPDWTNVYNRLVIRLSTHSSNGITNKDKALASSIDNLQNGI